jgi:type IV pilus assembly protein PilA
MDQTNHSLHSRKNAFTLIELMIVVAIIGILAALAIPNFLRFQMRSKTAEAKTNLAGIRTAQEGYFAEFGSYVPAAQQPAGPPIAQKTPWPAPGFAGGFDQVGWAPEGDVYFRYVVVTNGPVGAASEWAASALGDLDGDFTLSAFGYIHPIPGNPNVGAAPPNCNATGVYNPAAPAAMDLLNTVGPCEQFSGQSWF